MSNSQRDLTSLLGSRICHDLISPLGAIGNGVELLQMGGEANGPEMGLIEDSVANANAKVRYFRVAFGAAAEGQTVGNSELRDILKGIQNDGRLQYDWALQTDQPRTEVKLAFLFIQCLETSLPYGGKISVHHDGTHWILRATAEKMKIDPEIWGLLSDTHAAVDVTPALVHFALVPESLRRAQRKLSAELRETEITIQF